MRTVNEETGCIYTQYCVDGSGRALARWRGEVVVTVVDLKTSEAELIDLAGPFDWSMAGWCTPC